MKRENFAGKVEGEELVMQIRPQHKKVYAIRFNPESRQIFFDYTIPATKKKKKK